MQAFVLATRECDSAAPLPLSNDAAVPAASGKSSFAVSISSKRPVWQQSGESSISGSKGCGPSWTSTGL